MTDLIELLKYLAEAIAQFVKNRAIKTTLEAKKKESHDKIDRDFSNKSDVDIVDEIAKRPRDH